MHRLLTHHDPETRLMPAQQAKDSPVLLYDIGDVRGRLEKLTLLIAENANRERVSSLLLEHLPVAVWCADPSLELGYAIGAGLGGFGWPQTELEGGLALHEFLHCAPEAPIIHAHQRALEGHTSSEEMRWRESIFHVHIAPRRALEGAVSGVVAVALDITESRRSENALKRIEASSSAIRSALPDLIFHISREGRYLEYHAPDASALVTSPDEFLGKHLHDVMPPHVADAALVSIGIALDLGEVQTLRYALEIEGAQRDFEARIAALTEHEVLAVVREISRREEALRALRSSQEQLTTYNDIVVHDLANFSMSLQLIVSRLLAEQDGALSATQRQLLQRANRQTHEMGRLAENARILAQLHAGSLGGPPQPLDLVVSLNNAITRVRRTHFESDFAVALEAPDTLKLRTTFFLENILINLLDNAVRHGLPGEDGQRSVEIKVYELVARVQVLFRNPSDLAEDAVPALLEREAGSNLGIALVRDVVQRAGGDIEARIVTREGKRLFEFHFTLPKAGVWDAS